MTVCSERADWCEALLAERVPGRKTGELEGVIFRELPASLLLALSGAVVAIASGDERGGL